MSIGERGRRQFLLALACAACIPRAVAADRVYRVGVLLFDRNVDEPVERALLERLKIAGFIEGRNLRVDRQNLAGDPRGAIQSARRLVEEEPDVIYAITEQPVDAVKAQTNRIPVVFNFVTDPVARGYVRDLSQPAANLTGVTDRYVETGVKRLELLREIAPRAKRVGFFAYHDDLLGFGAWRAAAKRLGFEVVDVELGKKGVGLRAAIEEARSRSVDSLFPIGAIHLGQEAELVEFVKSAERHRLPAVYSSMGVTTRLGGLASLGLDQEEAYRRGGDMVVAVLQGQDVSRMPVQQPDRFRIAVNLRAARSLGITIPQSVLLRADEIVR